jgi:hypothetical protein
MTSSTSTTWLSLHGSKTGLDNYSHSLIGKLTVFSQIQEFSLRKPTMTSSTSAGWLSLHGSKAGLDNFSLSLVFFYSVVIKWSSLLVFNISKTKVLDKGTSEDDLFECAKHFLDTDPEQGLLKYLVLTDGLVHDQLLKFCQNTRTQFISTNINIPDSDNVITPQHKHVDRKISYEIFQKDTWGSFRNWSQQDIDLVTTCNVKLVFWPENYPRNLSSFVSESEEFRFLRVSHLDNLKDSVGLILAKGSGIRVTIPIDLSTWSFIPLPRFFNSRRMTPLLNQSLVLIPEQSA